MRLKTAKSFARGIIRPLGPDISLWAIDALAELDGEQLVRSWGGINKLRAHWTLLVDMATQNCRIVSLKYLPTKIGRLDR